MPAVLDESGYDDDPRYTFDPADRSTHDVPAVHVSAAPVLRDLADRFEELLDGEFGEPRAEGEQSEAMFTGDDFDVPGDFEDFDDTGLDGPDTADQSGPEHTGATTRNGQPRVSVADFRSEYEAALLFLSRCPEEEREDIRALLYVDADGFIRTRHRLLNLITEPVAPEPTGEPIS